MEYTITSGNGDKHVVQAEESITPGILITHAIGWDKKYKTPKWHVTHAGTSMKLDGDAPLPKKHAKLIAGAIGGLPIDWTKQTQQDIYAAVTAGVLEPFRGWLTRTLRHG